MTVTSAGTSEFRWDDRQRVWVRWTGQSWQAAEYAVNPDRLRDPTPFTGDDGLDAASRTRFLDRAVDQEVLHGATVVHRSDHRVVLATLRPVDNTLHFVVSLLTLGAWVVVWILMAVNRKETRRLLSIDGYGNVWATYPDAAPSPASILAGGAG